MKNKNLFAVLGLLAIAGFAAADPLVIPPDQPICNLYGIIQVIATIGGVIVAAYSGFQLATSHDLTQRDGSKQLIAGVILGLIIIWIAPLLVKSLVGATNVCGW